MNFSLYRGNLHKVPDVPRKWALAKPSISLHVFQKAIAKRREAVQRLRASQGQSECDALVNKESEQEALHSIAESDCQPLHDEEHEAEQGRKRKREDTEALGMEIEGDDMKTDEDVDRPSSERKPRACCDSDLATTEGMAVEGMECDPSSPNAGGGGSERECAYGANQPEMEDANAAPGGLCCAEQGPPVENNPACMENLLEKDSERLEAPRTPAAKDEECAKLTEHMTRELDGCVPPVLSTPVEPLVARRKAEIQEMLKQLQETKHQLVQILKQVLTNEEESKKKSQLLSYPSTYTTVGTLDLPLDQKTGSEMQSADLEEGELEYTRNSGPPVVASSYGSHFSAQPPTMGTPLGRQYINSQLSNKP